MGITLAKSEPLIDETRKASLTIIKYENAYGNGKNPEQNIPLENVEFTIYKLDEENLNKEVDELEHEIEEEKLDTLLKICKTTNKNGEAKFENLELGRYLVIETKVPKNVQTKTESFMIDLPRTNDDGNSWDYDVMVYPKNITVYGDVTLTKYDNKGIPLSGIVWELQIKKQNDYEKYDYEKYDYEGELVTNEEGKIIINDLPVGDYRLIEMKTQEGYILNQLDNKEFTVTPNNTSFSFDVCNEKPEIKKQVKIGDGYGKSVGAYSKEKVEWKITASIPNIIEKMKTYSIIDTLPNDLNYIEDSVIIDNLDN